MHYETLRIEQPVAGTLIDTKIISKQKLLEEAGYGSIGSCVEPVAEVPDKMAAEIAGRQETANVFDAISEIIIFYDNKMRIVWANTHACHFSGISREQVNSHKCFALLMCEDSLCAGCPVIKTLQTGKEQKAEISTLSGKVWFVSSYPTKDTCGNVSGAIAVVKHSVECNHRRDTIDFRWRLSLLTQREREVMELVAEGCSNKVMGTKLGISPRTVEIHRGRVMTKLRVTSTAELVRYITKYEIFGKLLTE
jgi:DNA-binding CsgD family transcriptional regulator